MTGLPKKYARMGFARGWRAFRASKKTKSTIKTTGESMAKRKRTASGKRYKKTSRKGSSLSFGGAGKLLGAGLYGAGREYLSNAIAPFTSKIPLGSVSDEVGMIAALWAGKKFLGRRVPLVNDVANAGMLIEASRIGATLASGGFSFGATSSGGSSGFRTIG